MTITIDHLTFVIDVSKSETVFVRTDPVNGREIRELDTESLMRGVNALLDDEEGMPLPDAFRHNTAVTLGGVTYARTIEILAPYTIQFEDGQYGVEFRGSNNNLADRTLVNQVSIRPNNSAGLVDTGLDDLSLDVELIKAATAGKVVVSPDGATITLYAEDGTTVLRTLDVTPDLRQRTIQ